MEVEHDYYIPERLIGHSLDAAASIITHNGSDAHVVNTWNSYIEVLDDQTHLIPVGGMGHTEKNLAINKQVKMTVANREIMGYHYPGTGVLITGTAEIQKQGDLFDRIHKTHPWTRGVMVVAVEKVVQTQ